jgi:hypothetical protein
MFVMFVKFEGGGATLLFLCVCVGGEQESTVFSKDKRKRKKENKSTRAPPRAREGASYMRVTFRQQNRSFVPLGFGCFLLLLLLLLPRSAFSLLDPSAGSWFLVKQHKTLLASPLFLHIKKNPKTHILLILHLNSPSPPHSVVAPPSVLLLRFVAKNSFLCPLVHRSSTSSV